MEAAVIRPETAKLPESSTAQSASARAGGGSFQQHLNAALQNEGQKPGAVGDQGTKASGSDQAPPTRQPHRLHASNGKLAPASSGPVPATVLAMSDGSSGPSLPEGGPGPAGTQGSSAGASSTPLTAYEYSWLTEMIPDGHADSITEAGPGEDRTAAESKLSAEKENPSQPAARPDAEAATSHASNSGPGADTAAPATSSAEATSGPDERAVQRAIASLERMGLSSFSTSTAAGPPLPTAPQAKTAPPPSSSAERSAVTAAANSKSAPKASANDLPQGSGKSADGSSGTVPQAATNTDATAPAKPASESSGGNSKNSGQDNSSKSSPASTAQASNSGNGSGSGTAAQSAAAQAASSGFPAVTAQPAQAASSTSHSGAPAQSSTAQGATGDKIAASIDNAGGASTGVINNASLVQNQGKTEMRVAMQTDGLGALQLHAVVDNGRLGASIQVVSHEAHTLLSNDLPALQQVLTDQHLRIDHLAVVNSPMSNGAGTGNGRNFHSEDFNQAGAPSAGWPAPAQPPVSRVSATHAVTSEELRGRLSVRA